VIADIRMINLHLFNFLTGHRNTADLTADELKKRISDFHKLNVAHVQEYVKRVSDYLKKTLTDMQRSKVIISPLVFRMFKGDFEQEDFLRFENSTYGLKFIITNLDKEAAIHLEFYRKVRQGRLSTLALRKLEVIIFESRPTIRISLPRS
jgi:hypothetical protein